MHSVNSPHCFCCGAPASGPVGGICQRCGYPLDPLKEEQFLYSFVFALERSARYHGPHISIATLVSRYKRRLQHIAAARVKPATPVAPIPEPPESPVRPSAVNPAPLPTKPVVTEQTGQPRVEVGRRPAASVTAPVAPQPERMFSLKTFFADQTINIVASLGAFLILVGSLSFAITTTNLLLSFLVLLIVHLVFGTTGIISYRFRSFRVVAVIYTAIFALQVPLVGYVGYRLITGSMAQISPSLLVAIAALYAAIAYGALAVYQGFEPFTHLSMISLAVVDIALCTVAGLGYWWWPGMLMFLSLPALLLVAPPTNTSNRAVGLVAALYYPTRFYAKLYIILNVIALLPIFYITTNPFFYHVGGREARFALLFMLSSLFGFVCLSAWRNRRPQWLVFAPYLFLVCGLSFAYALLFDATGYALLLLAIALVYHGLRRFVRQPQHVVDLLLPHFELVTVFLIALIPLITSPWLIHTIFARQYDPASVNLLSGNTNGITLAVLLTCLLLSFATIEVHTGVRRMLLENRRAWSWLLLVSGFVAFWLYGSITQAFQLEPMPAFLGYTIALIALAVGIRRFTCAHWAAPLDILALSLTGFTLLLSGKLATEWQIALQLSLAVIFYMIIVYQSRPRTLVVPFVLALLPCSLLWGRVQLLMLVSWLIPLLAAGTFHLLLHTARTNMIGDQKRSRRRLALRWIWPLLTIGLVYGCLLTLRVTLLSMEVPPLGLSAPFVLMILAGIWYLMAALLRAPGAQVIGLGFAVVALVSPQNSLPILLVGTLVLVLLAGTVSRWAGMDWAWSLYVLAILAGVMMGRAGYVYQQVVVAEGGLLGCALLLYLAGVVERSARVTRLLLWCAVGFALWSVYNAGLLHNYYHPLLLVLTCAAMGVGIGCIRFFRPALAPPDFRRKLLEYALPCYVTAIVAAIFTGLSGFMGGATAINTPFYAAIPAAMFLYALVAYGVLLFERYPGGLWLVALFAVGCILLAVQTNAYYVAATGLLVGVAGLFWSRVTRALLTRAVLPGVPGKTLWSWPWYIMSLSAAIVLACWDTLATQSPTPGFLAYALLAFAGLAYGIGVVEQRLSWAWIGVIIAVWSLGDAAMRGDVYRLLAVVLLCTAGGLLTFVVVRLAPLLALSMPGPQRLRYALPFYAVALSAAVWTALQVFLPGWDSRPFAGALPAILFLYALLAYGVALCERKVTWTWLTTVFAILGIIFYSQRVSCQSFWLDCRQAPFWFTCVASGCGLAGILAGHLTRLPAAGTGRSALLRARYRWSWPWYLIALVGCGIVIVQSANPSRALWLPGGLVTIGAILILLWGAIMLIERMVEFLPIVSILAFWLLQQMHWPMWQFLGACSLLCLAIMLSAVIWHLRPPSVSIWRPEMVHILLGIAGLGLVIVAVIWSGGLRPSAGLMAHIGAGTLALLASSSVGYVRVWPVSDEEQGEIRRLYYYGAGLLYSLGLSWEFLAWGVTDPSVLVIPPASYLIVTAPFLSRSPSSSSMKVGQYCAFVGAVLLLAPSLWFSFNQQNLSASLLLAGEALILFLFGIALHIRFFVLSGAALVIIGAIHLLFLPSLQIPPFLALTVAGLILLISATSLALARSRLAAWG